MSTAKITTRADLEKLNEQYQKTFDKIMSSSKTAANVKQRDSEDYQQCWDRYRKAIAAQKAAEAKGEEQIAQLTAMCHDYDKHNPDGERGKQIIFKSWLY